MDLVSKKCVPCEVGTAPMRREEAERYLVEVNRNRAENDKDNGWEIEESDKGLKIRKRFKFDSYLAGVDFVNKIAKVAEAENHHPDLYVGYKKVTVNLMTHNIGGLSENDFIMAAKIDQSLDVA